MAFPSRSGKQIRLIALTGLFMAVIYVLTAYLHIPTTKGYVHIGDGIIFLAASILPAPYAVAAASIGGALSDALSGYWIWVPATLMIKGLTALFFTSKREKATDFTADWLSTVLWLWALRTLRQTLFRQQPARYSL